MTESKLERIVLDDEYYYKIADSDQLRPFFMTIVSDSNHWLFVSSNGGLSAGRKNAQYALFPYYTDDKITESTETTGCKTIMWVENSHGKQLWEPFSIRQEGLYQISRNLYKNALGNKVIFEEINHDLGLTFSYQWSSSDRYGFVRSCTLKNQSGQSYKITLLDGLQNIIPANVGSDLQNSLSNLVDAYKRSELVESCGLGIYALSAIIVDKAEPSESLQANVVWSYGLEQPTYLLSSQQVSLFRSGKSVKPETDVKAEKGAYLISSEFALDADQSKQWNLIADVNRSQSQVVQLANEINDTQDIHKAVQADIAKGSHSLKSLVASVDGLQLTNDHYTDTRHFSNSLFNIMRGGKFHLDYTITMSDFRQYLTQANKKTYDKVKSSLHGLGERFSYFDLQDWAEQNDDADLKRLALEYLPLTFSRRHGDPSRPWNVFSINTRNEADGSIILDYQGNWRDIFQNWEALGYSYPPFVESMIAKFLNATTFDGYNPYRVTKDGFDWETIEPDNPWSYIGYWGDHQLIYLLKFLEFYNSYAQGALWEYFDQDIFVYADVPYRIKHHDQIVQNPKDTIEFDRTSDHEIRARRDEMGADGALLRNRGGDIHRVNFVEKILATLLAKVSNLIPGAGIWLNTQRPEWNDANNALVGNGVSMVTVCYLRRFLVFAEQLFGGEDKESVKLSSEFAAYFRTLSQVLGEHLTDLGSDLSDTKRRTIVDALGKAASKYRSQVYDDSLSGSKDTVALEEIKSFISTCQKYVEDTMYQNLRSDGMYHAYNLITLGDGEVSVSHLSEMLEGQVAALSSKLLSPEEALRLLDGMKSSALFRPDQYSYILYPNKRLPGFLEKNKISPKSVESSQLLKMMVAHGDKTLIEQDDNGDYHFNPQFRNANYLKDALKSLESGDMSDLVATESHQILKIYEEVFNHKAFTGRSGTFFGYEGLGSIYWHMVSKLLLAVQEVCLQAIASGSSPELVGRLLDHYYEINAGIGVHKSPALYGAFSTDAYSHTPGNKGAQQPGMTGQVKEDILSRFGEIGIFIKDGVVQFNPCLLRKTEFLETASTFHYVDLDGEERSLPVDQGQLCFTYCQVPIRYTLSEQNQIVVHYRSGEATTFDTLILDQDTSTQLIQRQDLIERIEINVASGELK